MIEGKFSLKACTHAGPYIRSYVWPVHRGRKYGSCLKVERFVAQVDCSCLDVIAGDSSDEGCDDVMYPG